MGICHGITILMYELEVHTEINVGMEYQQIEEF